MYLFGRSTVLADNDGLAWAVGVTEHAKRASGLEIELWGQIWSPEFGRVSWTTFVPDLESLAAAGDAMNADAGMNAETAKGRGFTNGGLDDALYNVLHGEIDPSAPQAEYVSSTSAVCANGKLTEGMTTGVEIAQRAEKVSGVPTMFVANVTGVYGGVGWISGYPSAAALEAAQQAIASDTSWGKDIDKAASAYSSDPSATNTLIFRRFA
jgi:hypothetical protein